MIEFLCRGSVFRVPLFLAILGISVAHTFGGEPKFTSFEARHTHSIAVTPDGSRVLALNSIAGSLSVFDALASTPTLLAEIPVGLEPVSVRARSNDEVWVVNEVGDSVSIVSLSKKAVVATLPASDEPADLVFAQGKAFITCARSRLLRVYDAATRQELAPILLDGMDPRALAVNAAGTKIYAAFLHSGNRTTVLPRGDAPPQPLPTNPNLSEAPNTALIVPADDSRIPYTVLDRDVAEIDVATGVVSFIGGTGTNLFDLALDPVSDDLWIANTESRNLIRFEPELRGHFVDHRLTKVRKDNSATVVFDLNPGVDYATLPNASAQATALAQPTSLVFAPDGGAIWVAAFASDRVAKISRENGEVLARVDVRGDGDSSVMRGPRALVLHPTTPRLFVLNKLADTLTVISTDTAAVTAEVGLSAENSMPANIRAGRGFLFDARISGNGTNSCASCHLDADRDGLAWDLGSQAGDMQTVIGANLAVHDVTPRPRVLHPMKGPMTTQTLRGMANGAPFHWRGDRPTLQSFNITFQSLMGGSQIADSSMDALAEYLLSLRNHPNPNRTKSNGLPATFNGGNPSRGSTLFQLHTNHCGICHLLPVGSDRNIDLPQEVGSSQPIKNPTLATVYQRAFFDPRPGKDTITGFGLLHDGTGSVLPTAHDYVLDDLATPADFADVASFVLCFESGTAPAVGDGFTVSSLNVSAASGDIDRLETMPATEGDLVVHGSLGGKPVRFAYARSLQLYVPTDPTLVPMNRAALLAALSTDGTLTFGGVPPGESARFTGSLSRAAAPVTDSFFTRSRTAQFKVPAAMGVLANDAGVVRDRDTAAPTRLPANGALTLNLDGSAIYTPAAAFGAQELDSFDYLVQLSADPNHTTSAVTSTVSTYASAAGRYFGHVQLEESSSAGGYVDVRLTSGGYFSAAIQFGTTKAALSGKVDPDGTLRWTRRTPFGVSLRVQALATGERRIVASLERDGIRVTGMLQRTPFSAVSPVPNPGKHLLTLTPGSATGTAPTVVAHATLTLGRTGSAKLVGKLGDGTAFSFNALLAERPGGGWRLMIYQSLYRSPAGTLSGVVSFDAASSQGITGAVRIVKPPQTRKGSFQSGFTLDYVVGESPALP